MFHVFCKILVVCWIIGQSLAQEPLVEQFEHKDDRIENSLPVFLPLAFAQKRQEFKPGLYRVEPLATFFKYLLPFIGETSSNENLQKYGNRQGKFQDVIPDSVPFPCPTVGGRSKTRPTSVDQLRPGDIDVIAALGDSLTTGNGIAATSLIQVFVENAGLNHLGGGQGTWRQYLTLPNILKEFNPNLIGYAYGDTLYTAKPERAQFNMAVPGGHSIDMPSMAKAFVHRVKHDPRVNFTEDWKMLSIFIGGVDVCQDICYWKDPWMSAVQHKKDLEEALDYLLGNSPRTFVNMVVIPNIPGLIYRFKNLPPLCRLLYPAFCQCYRASTFKPKRKLLLNVMREWRRIQSELPLEPKYRSKKDFIVIPQAYIAAHGITFPYVTINNKTTTDWRNFSPDCFHISQRGNAVAASGIWNNLLEPVGNKTRLWLGNPDEFKCPTQSNPYLNVDILTRNYEL